MHSPVRLVKHTQKIQLEPELAWGSELGEPAHANGVTWLMPHAWAKDV